MKQFEKANKANEIKLQQKTDEVQRILGELEAIKAESDTKHANIEKLKTEVQKQKIEEEKLVAKMKVLTEEAGNAAQLAEEVKDLKKENK